MELWIPITILAAFMQNLRSALQKHLKDRLSTTGATFSRFVYAAPLALVYVAGLAGFAGVQLPEPSAEFAVYAGIGALSQIFATALLVYLFSLRNFAVGTTFSKTETLQAAVFGVVVLGETVGAMAVFAIIVSLAGVMMLSMAQSAFSLRELARQWLGRPALIGIASGAFFGISAVTYRAASLSFESGGFVIRAAFTLVCVTAFQTLVMAIYLKLREPGQMMAVFRAWRISAWVGLVGMVGSVCWITAMTLQNAAYVRALGQIELLFTFVASYFIFKERSTRNELVGIALVTCGILILLFAD